MKIPKVISNNEHEYIFVKQYNEKVYMYQEIIHGYKECFTEHDINKLCKIEKQKERKRIGSAWER